MAAALVAALGELDELPRDKTAKLGAYSYSYTDLGSVLGYVRPILKQHGLAMLTPLTCDGQTVTVLPSIIHESGARLDFPPFSLPAGRTPQETGSAATYARRYSVLAVLNLATEDDDGAKATEGARRKAEAPAPSQHEMVEAEVWRRRFHALPDPARLTIEAWVAKAKTTLDAAIYDERFRGVVERAEAKVAEEAPFEPSLPLDTKP